MASDPNSVVALSLASHGEEIVWQSKLRRAA